MLRVTVIMAALLLARTLYARSTVLDVFICIERLAWGVVIVEMQRWATFWCFCLRDAIDVDKFMSSQSRSKH
jgi:hypothetical protein